MKFFKRILWVCEANTDPSTVLDRARTLTVYHQAELTVIDVLKELPSDLLAAVTTIPPAEIQKLAVQERLQELEQLIAPAVAAGLQVRAKVLIGTPFLEIIREVLHKRHDLVIKAAEGGRRTLQFGSTDLHLLRKCPCPVWIGKPAQPPHYARILAAVDPDPSDERGNALNAGIMDRAIELAQMDHSELHVAHAWDVVGEHFLRGLRSRLSDADVDRMVGKALNDHLLWLDQLLRRHLPAGMKHKKHLLRGDPGEVIPRMVREQQIDLVVMGTVARTGIPGLIIGNTAERVLDQVNCSVLAIKPEGFVTPVTLKPENRNK